MQRTLWQPIFSALSTSTSHTASKLVDFSTCEISDALIKLKLPHGGYLPDINMFSPLNSGLRICGPAYTVRLVLGSDTTAPKLSTHFVDATPADSIIVISSPPEVKNAVWGGLMTAGAIVRSAKGNFPVFARGHSTLGQSPFTRPSEINVALTIEPISSVGPGLGDEGFPAVTIQPGDWMIGDEDGVVCVPRELESKVLELAAKGRDIDDLCMMDIRAGKGIQASFKLHRGK